MSDDPETTRWEIARLEVLVEEARKLLPDLKIVLELASYAASRSAHEKDLYRQFADEGSKTAAYIVAVWGKEYPALLERSKKLAALALKFQEEQ